LNRGTIYRFNSSNVQDTVTGIERGSVHIRNTSNGNINLVAGWDPSILPGGNPFGAGPTVSGFAGSIGASDLLNKTYGDFGVAGATGRINVNPDSLSQIRIGSAGGETNLFGRTLFLRTGDQENEHVSIGWYLDNSNTVPITGNIRIELTETVGDSLIATGGTQTRQYIHIGHGAHRDDPLTPGNANYLSGNVTITSPGQTLFQAGRGSNNYVIVGHGGRLLRDIVEGNNQGIVSMTGDITLNTGALLMIGRDVSDQNFVLVGHGGQQIDGTLDPIPGAGRLTTNSNIVVNSSDGIRMVGGRNDAFAKIGSGGWQVRGNHTGTIKVTAVKDIEMFAVNPPAQGLDESFVMIGFGGWDSDGTHVGSIEVESTGGSIRMVGGGSPLDTSVDPAAVRANDSFVQIGNGGRASNTDPSGTIIATSPANSGGLIKVTAFKDIILQGMDGGDRSYVQIGHAGDDSDGSRTGDIMVWARTGLVSLDSGGLDDDVHNGVDAFTQIGHGGRDASGDFTGRIEVMAAGDVLLRGGTEARRYSLIGHGGRYDGSFQGNTADSQYLSFGSNDGGLLTGDIVVNSGGAISLRGGGSTVDNAGLGDETFAQIGHSLLRANPAFGNARFGNPQMGGLVSGSITVTAATGVLLQGGSRDDSFAAIGHGAGRTDNAAGNVILGTDASPNPISVTTAAGDIVLRGGVYSGFESTTSEIYRYATIGHHGGNAGFNAVGNIEVTAATGNVLVEGGVQRLSGARIGHGGDDLIRGLNEQHLLRGTINVLAGQDVWVAGGTGYVPTDEEFSNLVGRADVSYGMIGHGGSSVGRSNQLRTYLLDGNLAVQAQTVRVQGGDGSANFAAIGHGSYSRQPSAIDNGVSGGSIFVSGNVSVNAALDVFVDGGDGISNNVTAGDVYPTSGRNFRRNEGNFGHIGHFAVPLGTNSRLTTLGNMTIDVSAGRDIGLNQRTTVAGGSWGLGAHAMIGVGGNGYVAVDSGGNIPVMDIEADIRVGAGRDIRLYGATTGSSAVPLHGVQNVAPGSGAVAQIGNGGPSVDGGTQGLRGNISVRSRNDILLLTGVRGTPDAGFGPTDLNNFEFNNYAKIGHGDFMFESGAVANGGFRNGDIDVAAGRNVTVRGALIGHVDPRFSSASALEGSTVIAVDRADGIGAEGGYLLVDSLLDSNGRWIDPALEANVLGQLRIYTPSRSQNRISQTTYLNSVVAPFDFYDHPGVAGGSSGESGIPLLRSADELYDVRDADAFVTGYNQFFTFNAGGGVPVYEQGGAPYNPFAVHPNPGDDEYLMARNYTIYYNREVVPFRVGPRLPDQWDVNQDGIVSKGEVPGFQDDRYDMKYVSLGGPNWSSASRLAGVSSTYPRGAVQEDLQGFQVGGFDRPFEIFSWRTLMDWQAGGLTYVPGSGLIPVPAAVNTDQPGSVAPPEPPAGTFEFDFGATDEEQPGSTQAPASSDAGMGGAASDPFSF
jgi:hypothetical protein